MKKSRVILSICGISSALGILKQTPLTRFVNIISALFRKLSLKSCRVSVRPAGSHSGRKPSAWELPIWEASRESVR
ncbi:unnamed protein product, partial [Tenebrio molitor]